jgi:hypothetical protein
MDAGLTQRDRKIEKTVRRSVRDGMEGTGSYLRLIKSAEIASHPELNCSTILDQSPTYSEQR